MIMGNTANIIELFRIIMKDSSHKKAVLISYMLCVEVFID